MNTGWCDRAQLHKMAVVKFEIAAKRALDVPVGLAQNAKIDLDCALDQLAHGFVFLLRTWAIRGVDGVPGHFDVPDTWWDHFKETWFSDWMLARWPVKYRQLTYVQYYVCPHSTETWPDEKHFEFMLRGPHDSAH